MVFYGFAAKICFQSAKDFFESLAHFISTVFQHTEIANSDLHGRYVCSRPPTSPLKAANFVFSAVCPFMWVQRFTGCHKKGRGKGCFCIVSLRLFQCGIKDFHKPQHSSMQKPPPCACESMQRAPKYSTINQTIPNHQQQLSPSATNFRHAPNMTLLTLPFDSGKSKRLIDVQQTLQVSNV
jgi:hypothetical protein